MERPASWSICPVDDNHASKRSPAYSGNQNDITEMIELKVTEKNEEVLENVGV
jgi:hypothetical protein